MIVGISMHQPTSAGAHPPLDHHNAEHNAEELGYAEDGGYNMHQYDHHQSAAAASMMHSTMNGNAHHHHHQVYVSSEGLMGQQQQQAQHPGMLGLEQQFAQFGMHQQEGSDQLANSAHNGSSENNDTEHNEGEDLEEEPVKLFVGQVSFRNSRPLDGSLL
jgi:hypothetical protein